MIFDKIKMYNFNQYWLLLQISLCYLVCQICFANMLFLQLQLGVYLPNTYLKDVRSTGICLCERLVHYNQLIGHPWCRESLERDGLSECYYQHYLYNYSGFGHLPLHSLWEIFQAEWYKQWDGWSSVLRTKLSLEYHTAGKGSQPIIFED